MAICKQIVTFVKHFPIHHRYYKIFNKNTVKLRHSCMPNMENIATKQNNKLLFQSFEQPTRNRNFRDKASRPKDWNCLQKFCAYQAQVGSANSRKYCLGPSDYESKTRYNNNNTSSRNKSYEMETLKFQNIFGTWKTIVKIFPSNGVLLQNPAIDRR